MRGNDVLTAACDVLVTDPLTGNVIIKMLSSFTTGGSYESVGCGYGPGIGKGCDKLVMIVSRASGAPVIAGAMEYAAELIKGDYTKIAKAEFLSAENAGLSKILNKLKMKTEKDLSIDPEPKAPPKEVVTGEIPGIEITDLDNAVESLWSAGIYAESGMGCTGPVVLVNEAKLPEALRILSAAGWISNND